MITMIFGVLVIDSFYVTAARVQQENAGDSAALAGAETLTSEILLYADPSNFILNGSSLASMSAQTATSFGAKNYVGGNTFTILPADVLFDIVDIPHRTIIGSMPADPTLASSLTLQQLRSINAVQVVGHSAADRGNALRLPLLTGTGYPMMTRSEAVMDGYVYGFSPYVQGFDPTANPPLQNSVVAANPVGEGINIPLIPLAIYSDPTGTSPQSWEYQVETGVNFTSPTALAYGTMTITIGNVNVGAGQLADLGTVNSALLALGTNYTSNPPSKYSADGGQQTIDNQIRNGGGIAPADYWSFYQNNGKMPLALDTTVDPPAPFRCPGTPIGPAPGTVDGQTFATSLLSLQNTPMVWPLFTGYDNSSPARVLVNGFVVARVTDVQEVTIGGSSVYQLQLTPSMRATKTALTYVSHWPTTQPSPSAFFSFRFPNAYLKRIRLIR